VPAFVAPVDYTVGAYPIGIQGGDFNGDGIPDVATMNVSATAGSVSVLLSNGDGTFQSARNTPITNYYPYGYGGNDELAVGDFNRDGKLDLATSAMYGINILLGRGDGTFVYTVQPDAFGAQSFSIATGDMDGDGKPDLLEAMDNGFGENSVAVLYGKGDGTFSGAAYTSVGSASVDRLALADFNGDNKLDLVHGGYSGNSGTWVLLGTGQGYFYESHNLGVVAGSLTVADFNADEKTDLATTWGGSVNVLLGNGDGSFQMARSFTAAGGPVTAADVNRDGALDLVLGGGNVLLGTGDGNFGPPITTAATGAYLVVAAFNGDGRPDEALTPTTSATTVTVLFNDGIWDGSPPPPLPPSLRIGDATVREGNAGTALAVFNVTLSAPSALPVTVHYATANGTATAGSDYQARSGTLTIPAGQTTGMITVPVNGDRLGEPDETFFVNLSGATNATIADAQAVGTTVDDEPHISISDVAKKEGNTGTTLFAFTVSLSAVYDAPVTVGFATADGTATAGSDYRATSGTLTIPAGQTMGTITVLGNGDRLAEANESFFVNLSNPVNAGIADGQGMGTIVDDEPRISTSDVTKAEGKKGQTTLFTFTVTLSAAYDQPVTMSFQTVNGTATTSDGDYAAKSGTLTFAPGETTKTITIVVNGDSKKETNETFYLDLFGNSSNSLFTKNRGIGTILNDD
jgi:hypothetical protein